MAHDLTTLFCPKSIAIIGASRSPEKVGATVLKNIIASGFKGDIYPVNPNASNIGNLWCYKDTASLPVIPDLAVIAIPVPDALDVLTQVGEKGIKNAVVFSAGFKEAGEEGKKLEDRLIEIAQKYSINVLGPNCLGFVNNLCPVNVTFGEVVSASGNLRFISQSGAIASSLFDWCKSNNVGFSQFVTLGNKAVINENDVLEYFRNTPSMAVGLYLESISKGSEFLKLTAEISKTNPVFLLKPGKTRAGAKAMLSHTGSIAGEDAVLEAVLSQAGVIRCLTLEDFFDLSRSFAWAENIKGPRVAIISNAGGPAVISADAVINEGLELAEFDTETLLKLQQILPRSAGILNPVDVLGDALADRYAKAADVILANTEVDALIVILTPQVMTQIEKTAENLGNLSKKYRKLIFCSFIGGSLVAEGEQKLNELKIPHFRFPERAIWAVGKMWWYKNHQNLKQSITQNQIQQVPNLDQIKQIMHQATPNEIIALAGIAVPDSAIVPGLQEAKGFASKCGFPVVLKLFSPTLLHKKAIGGVITDIENNPQLESAWKELESHHLDIQIQKQVPPGVEVIIGVKKDPNFGPVLLFGAGGSYAELICDRNLCLLPIDLPRAKQLVAKSKIYSFLAESSLDKLYETIVRLANLALNIPEISNIEINPAIVMSDGVLAVDCKVLF
ncbi:MAG: acetate--CoA ligase family protein [Candidatus Daviesbacteria bacterium]|nr:acetate--CoA ligase family protein [Candidatus Daviesbacteria bacterium]